MAVVRLSPVEVEQLRAAVATIEHLDWQFAVSAAGKSGVLALVVCRPGGDSGGNLLTHHDFPADILRPHSGDRHARLSGFVHTVLIDLVLNDLQRNLVVGGKSVSQRERDIMNFILDMERPIAPLSGAAAAVAEPDLFRDGCPCAYFGTSVICECKDRSCGCAIQASGSSLKEAN